MTERKKPNDNYRVEVCHWCRTRDGDDWDITDYWVNFETLKEALAHADNPMCLDKNALDVKIYDMRDKYQITDANLIYIKDYKTNTVKRDWTTLPDFDYHNREYD